MGNDRGQLAGAYYRLTELARKQLSVEVSQFEGVTRAITRVIKTA